MLLTSLPIFNALLDTVAAGTSYWGVSLRDILADRILAIHAPARLFGTPAHTPHSPTRTGNQGSYWALYQLPALEMGHANTVTHHRCGTPPLHARTCTPTVGPGSRQHLLTADQHAPTHGASESVY